MLLLLLWFVDVACFENSDGLNASFQVLKLHQPWAAQLTINVSLSPNASSGIKLEYLCAEAGDS